VVIAGGTHRHAVADLIEAIRGIEWGGARGQGVWLTGTKCRGQNHLHQHDVPRDCFYRPESLAICTIRHGCASEYGPDHNGHTQVGSDQIGPGQVGPEQIGPTHIGLRQIGPGQVGLA